MGADEGDFLELLIANQRILEWIDQLKASMGSDKSANKRKHIIMQLKSTVAEKATYAEEVDIISLIHVHMHAHVYTCICTCVCTNEGGYVYTCPCCSILAPNSILRSAGSEGWCCASSHKHSPPHRSGLCRCLHASQRSSRCQKFKVE